MQSFLLLYISFSPSFLCSHVFLEHSLISGQCAVCTCQQSFDIAKNFQSGFHIFKILFRKSYMNLLVFFNPRFIFLNLILCIF